MAQRPKGPSTNLLSFSPDEGLDEPTSLEVQLSSGPEVRIGAILMAFVLLIGQFAHLGRSLSRRPPSTKPSSAFLIPYS